jgi:hypothetical protein
MGPPVGEPKCGQEGRRAPDGFRPTGDGAWRTGDVEAQLIILQDLARYWWRLAELKRISDRVNDSATETLTG